MHSWRYKTLANYVNKHVRQMQIRTRVAFATHWDDDNAIINTERTRNTRTQPAWGSWDSWEDFLDVLGLNSSGICWAVGPSQQYPL